MAKRLILLVVAVVVLVLAFAPAAFAATPQDIYDDFAKDGTLDGTYTQEELEAYLNDATIHQYGKGSTTEELDIVVRQLLKPRGEFPFTGFDILLMLGGAAVLIGLGVWLRRSSRKGKEDQATTS